MNAVRYHGPNVPLTLEKVNKPTDLGPDDILCKIHAAALCHTDLHFLDGTLDLGTKPMTLGHEACGIIEKVGSNVPASRIGERVILYYYSGCGDCRWCRQHNEQLCPSLKAQLGFVSDGGLAEYVKAPSRNAVLLPDDLEFTDAAPIACGVTTAVHACKMGRVVEQEWCVIYGVNGVGFGLVQLLKHHYGCNVIAVARSKDKRDLAISLGADVAIDGTDSSKVAETVRQVTDGEGADVIFECVGRRETMDACVGWAGALGKRGRLVMVGYHQGEEHSFRYHPIPMIVYEQTIVGSVGATLEDLKEAVKYVADGKIRTIVDSCIPLSDFQAGVDKIKACDCLGKIVCLPVPVAS